MSYGPAEGFLYLITDGSHTKIGRCAAPAPEIDAVRHRFRILQTGNPRPMTLLAFAWVQRPAMLEHALHRRHAHWRVQGEWFRLSPAALRWTQLYFAVRSDRPAHFIADGDSIATANAILAALDPPLPLDHPDSMNRRVMAAVQEGRLVKVGFSRLSRARKRHVDSLALRQIRPPMSPLIEPLDYQP
jgi:hypothetical protein